MAGVELYNNTANCRISEQSVRKRGVRRNCGWSDLNNNTAKKRRQKKQQRERIFEFSKKLFKNEEYGETVAGVISTTTQRRDANGEEKTTEKTTTGESLEPS